MMKLDLDTLAAVLGAQTVVGITLNDWAAGAFAVLGLFVGITLANAPRRVRQYAFPAAMAGAWYLIGPKLFS